VSISAFHALSATTPWVSEPTMRVRGSRHWSRSQAR